MATIGFIGLGNMGGPMAANLAKAGHQVKVFDLSEAALKAAAEHGCNVMGSAADAARDSEFVISMLPAGQHVEAVYLNGDTPLFDVISASALIIDSSTIDAATAKRLRRSLPNGG